MSLSVWSINCLRGSNKVALGYDEGTIMIKLGHEEPVASMEKGGKAVWAKNNDIQLSNLRTPGGGALVDGEAMNLSEKDLGTCEVYPQSLQHSPNGRLLVGFVFNYFLQCLSLFFPLLSVCSLSLKQHLKGTHREGGLITYSSVTVCFLDYSATFNKN